MLRASKASTRGRWRRLQATLPFCPVYTPSWGGPAPAASWGWGSHHASATHACKVICSHSVNSRAGSLREGLLRQPMLSPVSSYPAAYPELIQAASNHITSCGRGDIDIEASSLVRDQHA